MWIAGLILEVASTISKVGIAEIDLIIGSSELNGNGDKLLVRRGLGAVMAQKMGRGCWG